MRFEDLFLYDGMMHVFAFNYGTGPKRLTFQLQLLDHRKNRNTSFRERLEVDELHYIRRGRPTIYSGGSFETTLEKRAAKRNSIEKNKLRG